MGYLELKQVLESCMWESCGGSWRLGRTGAQKLRINLEVLACRVNGMDLVGEGEKHWCEKGGGESGQSAAERLILGSPTPPGVTAASSGSLANSRELKLDWGLVQRRMSAQSKRTALPGLVRSSAMPQL